MLKEQRPYAFIMSKGAIAPQKLDKQILNNITKRKSEIHSLFSEKATDLNRNTVLRRIIKNSS